MRQTKSESAFDVDEELYDATQRGDIEKLKSALESGVSPDACRRFPDSDYTVCLLITAAAVLLFVYVCLFQQC